MNQEQMDAVRLVIVTALSAHARVQGATMAGAGEGNEVEAIIGGFHVILTVEPV